MGSNYMEDWPCLGFYREASFVCTQECNRNEECLAMQKVEGKLTVRELPKFLSHTSPIVRRLAKETLEKAM